MFCLCTYFSFIYTGVSMVELTRFRVRLLVTYKPFSLFILETAGSSGTYYGTSAKFKSLNSSTLFSPLSSVPLTNTFRKLLSYATRKSYVIAIALGVPFRSTFLYSNYSSIKSGTPCECNLIKFYLPRHDILGEIWGRKKVYDLSLIHI